MAGDLVDALLSGLYQEQFGLRPYDAERNFPIDVGLGGPSTEVLATEYAPDGSVMNYPRLWFGPNGEPHLIDPLQAQEIALQYEVNTGQQFPRHPNIGAAETFAQNRSAMGGGGISGLARSIFNGR